MATPVGVGSVVVEDGWAGVHNMATATGHRRRGVARAVLHALLEWAAARGATRSYLPSWRPTKEPAPSTSPPATPRRYRYRAKRRP